MKSAIARLREGGEDSARAWLIVLGSFIIQFLGFGVARVSGVIFKALLDQDDTVDRKDASWPFTVVGVAIIYAGPMASFLEYRFSAKAIIIVGGLLNFLGIILCYFSTNIIYMTIFFAIVRGTGMIMAANFIPGLIIKNFKRFRSTATGIAMSGMSVGGLVLPHLVQYSLQTHGIKLTFVILAGVTLGTFIGIILMVEQKKPPENEIRTTEEQGSDNRGFEVEPDSSGIKTSCDDNPIRSISQDVQEEENTKNSSTGDENGKSCGDDLPADSSRSEAPVSNNKKEGILHGMKTVLMCRGFHLVTADVVCVTVLALLYMMVIVDYSVDKGLKANQGVLMMSVSSGAEAAACIFLGWITDRGYLSRPNILGLACSIIATTLLLLTFAKDYGHLMTCAAVYGLAEGIMVSTTMSIFSEYLEMKHVHLAVSFSRTAGGIALLPVAEIVGYFRDTLGSYDSMFHIVVGIYYVKSLVWIAEGVYRKYFENAKKEEK